MPASRRLHRSYRVEVLKGTAERIFTDWDEKARKMVQRVEDVPAGFMVHYYKGHSQRYWDIEALEAAGFSLQSDELVDEANDEVIRLEDVGPSSKRK